MWKKQAPNACFNLFLVLLLSPDSVAFRLSVNARHNARHNAHSEFDKF
jgi:hypothetical protein